MKRQAEACDAQGCSNAGQVRNGASPGLLLPATKAELESGVSDRPTS